VPEKYVAEVVEGSKVDFSVPAFPGETFSGTVARIARSVDVKTRTMAVEMDVLNRAGRLTSGMFPEVLWPVHRSEPTLVLPTTAIARTTEGTFAVRISQGQVEWVNLKTGEGDGKLVEVFGNLQQGDEVATRATDELRPGTRVTVKHDSAKSQ
jgi:RND family efflux transporter MFP subunit